MGITPVNVIDSREPSRSIAALASTISSLFGIDAPKLASEPALEDVLDLASRLIDGETIDKCLVFAPDALGMHIWPTCEQQVRMIRGVCPLQVPLRAVVPPKTPVCFASMFTGTPPGVHGITRYERPVLRCDTLFDTVIRSGRKSAIVAVKNSSMDLIFRDRDLDYFSENYDPEVTRRTLDILDNGLYDLIVVYQQEYDDALHRTHPCSEESIRALTKHVRAFQAIAEYAKRNWSCHNYAIVFAPDHGAHTDPVSGKGTHGEDIHQDMQVCHWYQIARREEGPV